MSGRVGTVPRWSSAVWVRAGCSAIRFASCRGLGGSPSILRSVTESRPSAVCATRWKDLLELVASGMTIETIIEDHPDLERDDVLAALEFGALVPGRRRVPFSTA